MRAISTSNRNDKSAIAIKYQAYARQNYAGRYAHASERRFFGTSAVMSVIRYTWEKLHDEGREKIKTRKKKGRNRKLCAFRNSVSLRRARPLVKSGQRGKPWKIWQACR